MTFEENLKKLENILEKLESGEIGLEEANKLFTEGVEISKKCFKMLEESKGKVTVLRKELEVFAEKPFNWHFFKNFLI